MHAPFAYCTSRLGRLSCKYVKSLLGWRGLAVSLCVAALPAACGPRPCVTGVAPGIELELDEDAQNVLRE